MMGPSAKNGQIDVICDYYGSCNEEYSLVGSFTSNSTWEATFTATFTGTCYDCFDQVFSITGTRM
ncbi:MAG: hypothetical protein ACXADS_09680 [Candidatus Thorarchaeota archaeon]